MDKHQLSTIEHAIEGLVEGLFAPLIGRRASLDMAHGWLEGLNRTLAAYLEARPGTRTLPGHYALHVHPSWVDTPQMREIAAALPGVLGALAAAYAVGLPGRVTVGVAADAALPPHRLAVVLNDHSHAVAEDALQATGVLAPVATPTAAPPPGAVLTVGARTIALEAALVTIGRSLDNTVVLDDPYVSRFHAQMRLRQGRYLVFGHGGAAVIRVNGVSLREHWLQSGDLIEIGRTALVYTDHAPAAGHTEALVPLDSP